MLYVFAISNLHCTLLDKERDKSASLSDLITQRGEATLAENLFDRRGSRVWTFALRIYIPYIKAP